MSKRIPILLGSFFLAFATACEKDDNNGDDNGNNSNESGNGSASISLSGEVSTDLGDYATWEINRDQLLRIRLGSEFPHNLVLNYRLGSNALSDLNPGTFSAVSATYTGQPADEMALQYNGDETQFPDSGTITIKAVNGNTLEGELDVTISTINGAGSSQVTGSFAAEPLE